VNLRKIRFIALSACTLMAVSVPVATAAQAATSSTAASHRTTVAEAQGCSFDTANLHDVYVEAAGDKNLDWTARNSATQGNPVILEPVSGSSDLDCFQPQGNIPGHPGALEFQLANSDLCLNVKGDSHSVGAYIILWPCVSSANEAFYVSESGVNDSEQIQAYSSNSLLCIDLDNGYQRGSILELKAEVDHDIYQSWYYN
jgi:hypothetical protein